VGRRKDIEQEIARVATRQFGVIRRDQLLRIGLSGEQIKQRLRDGRLTIIHRGVYAVGHSALSCLGTCTAALLAIGRPSALSHLTAAFLDSYHPHQPTRIDVTTTARTREGDDRIRLHRVRSLPAHHLDKHKGLPITRPARTLLDLAETVTASELTRLIGEAEYQRKVTRQQLIAITHDVQGRRGIKALTAIVGDGSPQPTHSEFEDLFLKAIQQAGLPRPVSNIKILGYRPDFLWPQHKVIVETDGGRGHETFSARERDPIRDARLQIAGYRVMRVTWHEFKTRPSAVIARLAALLAVSAPVPASE
jgi:very-short-patch-repair endonuclease